MAIDLPLMPVPYPDAKPAYQIGSLLEVGITTLGGSGSCWVQITENLIIASIRVNPSGAIGTQGYIASGLPSEFWPLVNTPDTAQQQVFLMNDGRIFMRPAAGRLQDMTELNATIIAARKG
ncbi:hypothetical protein ACNPON_17815 [Glutamicibacter sp. AGC13]